MRRQFGLTHRPLSSSLLGLPYRIQNINHKKERLRGLWVTLRDSGVRAPRLPALRYWAIDSGALNCARAIIEATVDPLFLHGGPGTRIPFLRALNKYRSSGGSIFRTLGIAAAGRTSQSYGIMISGSWLLALSRLEAETRSKCEMYGLERERLASGFRAKDMVLDFVAFCGPTLIFRI